MSKFQGIITKIGKIGIFPGKDKLNLEAEKEGQTDLGGVYKRCEGKRRKKTF